MKILVNERSTPLDTSHHLSSHSYNLACIFLVLETAQERANKGTEWLPMSVHEMASVVAYVKKLSGFLWKLEEQRSRARSCLLKL